MCSRLEAAVGNGAALINASHLFWAVANDIIGSYMFGVSLGFSGARAADLSGFYESRAFGSLRLLPLLKMWPMSILYETFPSFMRSISPAGRIQAVRIHRSNHEHSSCMKLNELTV
jgi:hypothetical protein